jgi:hypothetical protein
MAPLAIQAAGVARQQRDRRLQPARHIASGIASGRSWESKVRSWMHPFIFFNDNKSVQNLNK